MCAKKKRSRLRNQEERDPPHLFDWSRAPTPSTRGTAMSRTRAKRVSRHPTAVTLVYATWCPHCTPLSEESAERLAHGLGVPLRRLDIDDREQEKVADALVERYGDNDPDYLIPQVFLEWSDGRVEHLLTGDPRSVGHTRSAWDRVLIEWLPSTDAPA